MNMNENIKFSITIPAYKTKYLSEAIDSCLNQNYVNFELIIVDDASPEDVWAIVEPYLKDDRVYYYRNERNCGAIDVVDNWNICLSYCSGDYVICIGDDDKLLPNCLDEYYNLIIKYPGLCVYHAWTEIIDENSQFFRLQEPRPEWESALSLMCNRWMGRVQFIGDFCYEINSLRNEGGYYKLPLAWGSDDITAIRAAEEKGIANTQKVCFQYRQSRYTISQNSKFADIKVSSIEDEFRFYSVFIQKQKTKVLSYEDSLYLFNIQELFKKGWAEKIMFVIRQDISTCPKRAIHWIALSNKIQIGKFTIAKSGIKSLLRCER